MLLLRYKNHAFTQLKSAIKADFLGLKEALIFLQEYKHPLLKIKL